VERGSAERWASAGAFVLSVLAVWLMVAGWIDARHPAAVLAVTVSGGSDAGSPSWWVIAAGLTRPVPFILGLAGVVAGWAHLSKVRSRTSSLALLICGWAAAAMAIVGEVALATKLSGSDALMATPDTLVADAAVDLIVGLGVLIAAVLVLLRGWTVERPALTGVRRWLSAPAIVVAFLVALGALTVVPVGENSGDERPQLVDGSFAFAPPTVSETSGGSTVVGGSDSVTTSPEDTSPAALASRLAAQLPQGQVRSPSDGRCMDESMDVAGTHAPIGCVPLAIVDFTSGFGTQGNVEVDHFTTTSERDYQYDVELRYMRQYTGSILDARVPGIRASRMIHTGSSGDLFAVLAKTNHDLIVEFVSADGSKSIKPQQMQVSISAAQRVAKTVTGN